MAARRRGLLATAVALFLAAGGATGALLASSACACATPTPEAARWPKVTGSTDVGGTLTTDQGTWVSSGNLAAFPNTGYTYQWERCNTAGAACSVVAGATASTYSVTALDGGFTIRSIVKATNAGGSTAQTSAPTAPVPAATYDQTVLADGPAGYWPMSSATTTEADASGHGHSATYHNGHSADVAPDGDTVAGFNGSTQYAEIANPSDNSFSVPVGPSSTPAGGGGQLTWAAWVKPYALNMPNFTNSGYVDFMGKCYQYSPTCEWEGRMYNTSTTESTNRPNRFSDYVFSPSAGFGVSGDWQPGGAGYPTTQDYVIANHWYFVVGEAQNQNNGSDAGCTTTYLGTIDIWVNGVKWNQQSHNPTGCFSQYNILMVPGASPVEIGTMEFSSYPSTPTGMWDGAIGKVAIFDRLLTQAEITQLYTRMTGLAPGGSCAATCTLTNP